ncbi:biosynthetic arginine decarboxylase [Colwellia sp. 1_MG-2023]|uniref:biosynthetic arginine decarboxylase n=1 Tax=Colwellia sp. 1_MG-2023 TaxID=3062649 RepID=UPI0026E1AD50|nr:biosynthetic arginine decarboxylase [Colwellia sp. 1_MG-2023]MDO6446231.1 biosynthetic arginine decarboxylase [Colwellia sp. 1_MG-2023]
MSKTHTELQDELAKTDVANERTWSVEDAEKTYRVQRWGNGYFAVGKKGNIEVTPRYEQPNLNIDLREVVDEMSAKGIEFPAVIRFHDILRSQVERLNRTFRSTIESAEYEGRYLGVFPVKVNQMREVIEEIVDAGERFDYGLEAGSKPELIAALAYNTNKNSLTILNGYKDEEYLRLALLGVKINRKIVIVIEKFSELTKLISLSKELNIVPMIGLRVKMMVKGRGKWESSSGERAKFGLSIAEILNAVSLLEQEGLSEAIKLLHFHIGSQLTDIRAIKEAVQEASLIYSRLVKKGVPLEYVDVGGGLAVDYDGSQSTNDSSCNYSIEEYIADIVYGFKQNCDLEGVSHPHLVSESGRAMTAHHSCVVTKVIGEIHPRGVVYNTRKETGEHIIVTNFREIESGLTSENHQEVYNDIAQLKEQAMQAFKLGIMSLEEMAKIEIIYWRILGGIDNIIQDLEFVPEELKEIPEMLSSQYLANFSVFQSAADSWAIDQVLPIVPISRLNEKPSKLCSLVDITCDSDGKIDKFIGDETVATNIPLHSLNEGEDYFIGIFLTGAYQDVMGDMHNLFGRLNEVHIVSYDDDPKDFYMEEVVRGSMVKNVLSTMQYTPEIMAQVVKKEIDKQIQRGKIKPREGVQWIDFYDDCLEGYTYLK